MMRPTLGAQARRPGALALRIAYIPYPARMRWRPMLTTLGPPACRCNVRDSSMRRIISSSASASAADSFAALVAEA
ncbi:hypothetical protein [Actinomadura macra]|uniref:hypothetical protein n=1 Tax=Actinomadura macra TaxID=46164 RepID=UPI0012FB6093|nr:hypothetical protein [Actinomadura macra]